MDQERLNQLKSKYPNVPEHCLPIHGAKKKKSKANQLTDDIIQYFHNIGFFAFRINSQGTYSEKLGKFIYSGSTKGVSDVIACLNGLLIGIEVKIGSDKQSDVQKRFQERIEAAGGKYMIAKDFNQFKEEFKKCITINAFLQVRESDKLKHLIKK